MSIVPEALIKRSRPQYNVNHLLLMYVGPGKSKDIDAIDFTLDKYSKLSPYNTKRFGVIEQGKAGKDSLARVLPARPPAKMSVATEYRLQKDYESQGLDVVYKVPRALQRLASDMPYVKDTRFTSYAPVGNSEKRIDSMASELPLLKRTQKKRI